MKEESSLQKALRLTQTKGITQKANQLVDSHLTNLVTEKFEAERTNLDINHLNVSLKRKSGKTEAVFETDSGTTLTKSISNILSEGEQRALALSAFMTEVGISAPDGPIVVDDPVSSLDRRRSQQVADRLAEEASSRQVIVFTHDIVFFNELCSAAQQKDIEPVTRAIFANQNGTGIVDPEGEPWTGKNVQKRVNILKQEIPNLNKIHNDSPGKYEMGAQNWYSRLRRTYERAVEERLFHRVLTRYSNEIRTKELRFITLPDNLVIRFHEGMTKASAHSHDNPEAGTTPIPEPHELQADIDALESWLEDLLSAQKTAEKNRSIMA